MKKLFSPLALAFALVSTLTGCELYFGGNDSGDDHWTYCANDGYYVCDGDNCDWAGARCPDDPNYTCESDRECAAGCYCSADGICEEAGFCNSNTDCPDGYSCDTARSSCVPDGCSADTDCDQGEYCDAATGTCTSSCLCENDMDAQNQGFGFCDEARNTCEPTPDTGSCVGTVTCTTAEPVCAVGEVALVKDECYTGGCSAIAACDLAPACESRQHEADCLGVSADCTSVYYGINCTNSAGTACQPGMGDTSCVCQSFQFAECRTRVNAMMVYPTSDGSFVDVFAH